MVISDNIGLMLPKRKGKALEFDSSFMKEQDSYLVPMEMASGTMASVCVNIGDTVKEGTLIGKPKDRRGCFVYSPISGKVTAIVQQLSLCGNLVDHVLIVSDKKNQVKTFPKLEDFTRKAMIERLMVSGIIGEENELCYIKYVRKPNTKKTRLIVSCIDNDPYVSASEVNFRENIDKCIKGSYEFMKLAETDFVTFVFTSNQKSAIKALKKYIKDNKLKNVRFDILPNIYPLTTVELTRYIVGKNLNASGRWNKGVYIENCFTCKQYYEAIFEGKPVISRLVTIGGTGFVRKGNYEIKVGTSLGAIMEYVGVRQTEESRLKYKMICGGAMSGSAQESPKVTMNLSVPAVLFLSQHEFSEEKESPCMYCGKCADVCPAKIMPYKIDEFLASNDFDFAKQYGIECCTSCGACSYVCPAKRYLAQRISDGRDKIKEGGDL